MAKNPKKLNTCAGRARVAPPSPEDRASALQPAFMLDSLSFSQGAHPMPGQRLHPACVAPLVLARKNERPSAFGEGFDRA